MIRTFFLVIGLSFASTTLANEQDMRELQKLGTLLRLQGDFNAADKIETRLIKEYDIPVGHIFALNSIVTHLTWDESQTQFDEALQHHAEEVLNWCEPEAERNTRNVRAHYYCGQANFALAFHYGLKGKFYQAGRRGTQSIENMEAALALDADLTDAKMHLGVAYHVADNLPPYIKVFSRFLWFIPTGNSEKSLPYLHEVVESGDIYKDVARYIYAITLLNEPDAQKEATDHLQHLVDHYPANPRFQLRLISALLIQERYPETLVAGAKYIASEALPEEPMPSLTKIWMVRAYMGLKETAKAVSLFDEATPNFLALRGELPAWSVNWHLLTEGQLSDLTNRRNHAIKIYEQIVELSESAHVNNVVLDAARAGLRAPYSLD